MPRFLSLAEAYPLEQARVRDVLSLYRDCDYLDMGPTFDIAVRLLEQKLREADEAAASGDVVRMVRAYKSLKEIQA